MADFDPIIPEPGNILLGDNAIIYGTIQLGSVFGEVVSASLKHDGEMVDITNGGGDLRALLIRNPHFVLDLKTQLDSDIEVPGMLAEVTFPLVGLIGNILPPISVDWADSQTRQLSIQAKHWISLGDQPSRYYIPTTGVGAGTPVALTFA